MLILIRVSVLVNVLVCFILIWRGFVYSVWLLVRIVRIVVGVCRVWTGFICIVAVVWGSVPSGLPFRISC